MDKIVTCRFTSAVYKVCLSSQIAIVATNLSHSHGSANRESLLVAVSAKLINKQKPVANKRLCNSSEFDKHARRVYFGDKSSILKTSCDFCCVHVNSNIRRT